ncbi:DNA-directed RNA polymerase subunit delta [Halalkalibacter sp. APA_J-10(15)]|uniref:DNA-directed RNA polymerase subunit delta n=1 Tax=unclassified Halalkalibacter TaxID=2893063 RepID=UPI001FF2C8F8|nr:DNA-directed RNA polymerase subunit delta [Halalkalibacter sp. APA_J-10(15)]MCK0470012.1 DNA-directed RNA polymerase subunit delta [Halalkalibacter sp. APA_J-10(15)]
MGLELSKDEVIEHSMVEIAYGIMKKGRKPYDYYDLMDEVAKVKGMNEEQVAERIANLYTDLNIDGRFHSLGDNTWGLKSWYALEQAEEEITTPVKPKKKSKATADLDDDFDDYEDEYEDLEDELDEIAMEDDADKDEESDEYSDGVEDIDEDEDDSDKFEEDGN